MIGVINDFTYQAPNHKDQASHDRANRRMARGSPNSANEDIRMIPHIKITSEKMPSNAAGQQVWFVIKLRKAFRTNQPLIKHELEHVKQWWLTTALVAALLGAVVYFVNPLWPIIALAPFAHGALYTLVRPYRKWAEVAAHRVQVKAGGNRESLAKHLSSAYKLKLTYDEAWELIG